jgi:hypothetical protein
MEVDPQTWVGGWLAGGLAVGLIANMIRTWVGRPTYSDAAVEIDRRFGLRERLSSALLLTEQDRQHQLAQALVVDANRRAETLEISDKFQWGFQRSILIPIVLGLCSLSFFLIPDRQAAVVTPTVATLSTTQIKSTTQPLLNQIRKKREAAEKEGLQDAVDIFKKLEGELEKMQKDASLDQKKALAKLNNIKEQLNERRKELGNSDALKKNLQNMEKFESGPADKLTEALKQGDFEKAEDALQELMESIKGGKMDNAQMEKLKKQLEQLEKGLKKSAQDHQMAKQALKEQINQAKQSGDNQRAEELQRKLEQLQSMDSSMAQMQQMADMLSKCEQCMKNGDQQGLQEALGEMASQISEMNMSDGQLQDLDQLMDSLSECKNGMCEGMSKMMSEMPGRGMGEGRGEGERPEEESDVNFFDSQVRDKMKKGQTVFGGKIGGENRKGISRVQVQEEIQRELAGEPEPLDETPLPKNQREHTRDYFKSLRDGK